MPFVSKAVLVKVEILKKVEFIYEDNHKDSDMVFAEILSKNVS